MSSICLLYISIRFLDVQIDMNSNLKIVQKTIKTVLLNRIFKILLCKKFMESNNYNAHSDLNYVLTYVFIHLVLIFVRSLQSALVFSPLRQIKNIFFFFS